MKFTKGSTLQKLGNLHKFSKTANTTLNKNRKDGICMKVKECMCEEVYTCTPETTISQVAKIMCGNHIGCVPVCDEQQGVVGIVTDRDIILRAVACDKEATTTRVSDIMTSTTTCCEENADVKEASKMMGEQQIRRLPVTDNGKLVGILTLGDLARHKNVGDSEVGKTAECICGCDDKNAE